MGNKANPTVIGVFVVGALVLIVAGVLILSGGKFFSETNRYVLYFDGSVTGLNVGAPVRFRGVQIGRVLNVTALYSRKTDTLLIEVVIEVTPGKVTDLETRTAVHSGRSPREIVAALIKRGMRASLQTQSMLTGLLYVELDFYPDTPVRLLGVSDEYIEIPTVPSTMERLFAKVQTALRNLGDLPLDELAGGLVDMVTRINTILHDPQVDRALTDLGETLHDLRQAAASLPDDSRILSKTLSQVEIETLAALKDARLVLQDGRQLINHLDRQLGTLSGGAQATLTDAQRALDQARKTITRLEDATVPALRQAEQALSGAAIALEPDARLKGTLTRTLVEIEAAARSIRVLADYLQRDPSSLIRGRSRSGG
jgi:paraquat-inducible protein B